MPKSDPKTARTLRAVGRRIRALRRAARLNLEQLAGDAGIHENHLGMVERGTVNPSLDVLAKIAEALHVEIAALVETREVETAGELRRVARERISRMDDAELRRLLRLLDALR